MGYHVEMVNVENSAGSVHAQVPVICKDGGTGAWREAKKMVRQWHLDQITNLRKQSEKSYFGS